MTTQVTTQGMEQFPLEKEGVTWALADGNPIIIKRRPLNAFIVFKGAREAERAKGKAPTTSNFDREQGLSKDDSIVWKRLSKEERAPFYAQAKAKKDALKKRVSTLPVPSKKREQVELHIYAGKLMSKL